MRTSHGVCSLCVKVSICEFVQVGICGSSSFGCLYELLNLCSCASLCIEHVDFTMTPRHAGPEAALDFRRLGTIRRRETSTPEAAAPLPGREGTGSGTIQA